MASQPGFIRRFFIALWRLLDFSRRLVFNLIFLFLVAIVLLAWVGGSRPALQPNTALVLNLQGDLVEQYSGSSYEAALAEAIGQTPPETRLRDVTDALEHAAGDPKIARVVLVLDELSGGGTASLNEVAEALARFKQSGKQVVAWGSSYTQRQYFLAAHADEVYLHPEGSILLRGMGGATPYFKEALDKLGVTIHTFQAGKYKSAVEPFTRKGPSPEALEADAFWLSDVWATWTARVEKARSLPAGAINKLIDALPQRLAATQGDPAQLAVQEKLVTGLKTRDEFRALMIERGAPIDEKKGTFRQVPLLAYAATVPARAASGDVVGVVVASGEIVDDEGPQGMVGGLATAELIRRAREDDSIKALVLRVDSPGGSVFGSELIRRELELTQRAGKPVVASFGDVAASGGYWISMTADQIVADPSTITGSIGVFGMLPTFEKAMDKIGVNAGGATTTWLANTGNPLRPLDPRLIDVINSNIAHTYRQFLKTAAAGRNSTPEKINEVAQGRVWSGKQAFERGLVDTLGSLHEALEIAANRAGLDPTQLRVEYLEREPRGFDRWLALFLSRMAATARAEFGWQLSGIAQIHRDLQRDLRVFDSARDNPLRAYAYCFCRAQQ